MASAKMTLIGMYNYDNTLFANLTMPEGIEKDNVINCLLLQGGEFEVQHGNPVFIHDAMAIWSGTYYDTMDRWIKALAIEYAPLENYDRMEHWTDELDGTGSSNSTGTLDNTTTEETERTKSAFDSSTYQPYDKVNGRTVSDTDSTDRTNTTVSNDSEHNGRIHGNIGVTTSQQMLLQELDLGYWNLYQRITQLFLQEFVIPIYE